MSNDQIILVYHMPNQRFTNHKSYCTTKQQRVALITLTTCQHYTQEGELLLVVLFGNCVAVVAFNHLDRKISQRKSSVEEKEGDDFFSI